MLTKQQVQNLKFQFDSAVKQSEVEFKALARQWAIMSNMIKQLENEAEQLSNLEDDTEFDHLIGILNNEFYSLQYGPAKLLETLLEEIKRTMPYLNDHLENKAVQQVSLQPE